MGYEKPNSQNSFCSRPAPTRVNKTMKAPALFRFLLLLALATAAGANAASLALNPTSTTPDYTGNVTLTITGVPNGATVAAELFMDFNGDGIVDANEPLIRRFTVTDGQVPVFGGIRNVNAPGDDDGTANGQMTVNVSYARTDQSDHFKGKFVWRVTSPTSAFSAVTASLTVTDRVHAQPINISGSVSGATYCVVLLIEATGQQRLLSGVMTDASGNYNFVAPPGTYLLSAARCGTSGVTFVTDFTNPAQISFPTGGTTNGLTLGTTTTTRTITGRIVDEAGNGVGGAFIEANSTNGLFALTYSDANGDYTLSSTSSQWEIEVASWSLARNGHTAPHRDAMVITTTGSVANVNFTAPRVNALIYGMVTNEVGAGVTNIQVQAEDSSFTYEAVGYSDASGNYVLGVFGGTWFGGADTEDLVARGFVGLNFNGSPATNAAVQRNVQLQTVTTYFHGRVVDQNNNPLGEAELYANQFPPGWFTEAKADGSGFFTLGLFAGPWFAGLNNDTLGRYNVVGPTFNFTNGPSVSNYVVVARQRNAQLTGVLRDTLGNALTNVQVYANVTVGTNTYNLNPTFTDGSGNFALSAFTASGWTIATLGLSSRNFVDAFEFGFDINGNTNITLTATTNTALTIVTTSPLPAGSNGAAYSRQLQAIGGFLPYFWTVTAGALPAGLTLGLDGRITGTPTATGTFNFTVDVNSGPTQAFSLTIHPSGGPADSTPPTLVETTPHNFQRGIQTHSGIAFTFSEPMQANQSITWSGNVNPANFRYDWATNGLTLFCTYNGLLPTSSTISWTLNPTGQSLFRDLAGNPLPSNIAGSFSTVATNGTGVSDALQLTVYKTANYVQTNASVTDVVPLTTNTHTYGVSIRLSGHITVTNILSDINNTIFSYVPFDGSEGDSFQFESQNFTSQGQMDALYPNGNHSFSFRTVHEGTNNVTVPLTGDLYPAAPVIANYAAAQSVNSSNSFTLSWNPFTNGTANDFVLIEINERLGNDGFLDIFRTPDLGQPGALNGTATSVAIPANTFAAGSRYNVSITFVKGVYLSTTNYPPLVAGAYGAETSFQLQTAGTPAQPSLAFTTVPGESHRHVLVTGEPFRQYQLQAATNLSSPVWEAVTTLRTIGRTNTFGDTASPNHPRRYYRAILVRDN
jgi:hypothetical protein